MAIATLSGAANVSIKGSVWKDSNDNLYAVALVTGTSNNDIGVWKSSDNGANWTQQDTGNRPSDPSSGTVAVMSAYWVGGTLHIAHETTVISGMTSTFNTYYHTFNTSDAGSGQDTWIITDESIAATTVADSSSNCFGYIKLFVRGNGDVILCHAAGSTSDMGTSYQNYGFARRTSGTWNTGTLFQGDVTTNHQYLAAAFNDIDDQIHVRYTYGSTVYVQTINSDNSMSTRVSSGLGTTSPTIYTLPGVSWFDGSSQRVLFPDRHSSGYFGSRRFVEDGNGEITTDGSTIQIQETDAATPGMGLSVDTATGDIYAHLGRFSSTQRIMYDVSTDDAASWGTDTEVDDAGAISPTFMDGKVYTVSGSLYNYYMFRNGTAASIQVSVATITAGSPTFNAELATEEDVAVEINDWGPVLPPQFDTELGEEENEGFDVTFAVQSAYKCLRPTADIATNGWTTSPLWQKMDEDPFSDADFITSPTAIANAGLIGEAQIQLDTSQSVTSDGVGVIWRCRARITGSAGIVGVVFELRNGSDNSVVQRLEKNISTSFTTVEQSLSPQMLNNNVIDWDDLYVAMTGSAGVSGSFTIQVSWMELCVPNPAVKPAFNQLSLHPFVKQAGPLVLGGVRYVLAYDYTEEQLWLCSSSSPSDGHNPGDWTTLQMIEGGPEILAGSMWTDGTDLIFGSRVGVTNPNASAEQDYVRGIRYEIGTGPTVFIGRQSANNETVQNTDTTPGSAANTVFAYSIGTTHYIYFSHITGNSATVRQTYGATGVYSSGTSPGSLNDGNNYILAGLAEANNRQHLFYLLNPTAYFGDNRAITIRSNGSDSGKPGSSWSSSTDLGMQGSVISYNSEANVIAAFRVGTSGIRAAMFASADSPTVSESTVTTRDATTSTTGNNPAVAADGTIPWVFWLDEADSWAVWGAYYDGAWNSQGQMIAGGGNGWDNIHAGHITANTIAVIVSTTDGNIFYYEFNVATTPTINAELAEEEDEAFDVTMAVGGVSLIVDVASEEDEAFDVAMAVPYDLSTTINLDYEFTVTLEPGFKPVGTGLGIPRQGKQVPRIYLPSHRVVQR